MRQPWTSAALVARCVAFGETPPDAVFRAATKLVARADPPQAAIKPKGEKIAIYPLRAESRDVCEFTSVRDLLESQFRRKQEVVADS
jgi:hypothetical protein